MNLQLALLLMGIVFVVAIGIGGYEKSRLNRRQLARHTRDHEPASMNAQEAAVGDAAVGEEQPLDINPGPPTDLIERSLKSDGFVAESSFIQDSELQQEFENAERIASVPVSISPRAAATSGSRASNLEQLFPPGQLHGPNPKIDFIVHLPGRGPLLRDQALGIYKQNEYVLEKPRQLYGLRYLAGDWFPLERDAEDSQYSDLALAIQMVDESGPIEESEIETFLQVALKLADALKRRTKLMTTVERALATAGELQEFAQKYDVLASVNVTANSADFTGRAIKEAAEHFGMHLGEMNIFHMKNNKIDGCRHLFSMANLYQPGSFEHDSLDSLETGGLTLFMAIPCVRDPTRVFRKMVKTARGLSEVLGGRMIDQQQRVLTEQNLAAIQQQIGEISSNISAQGIVPGSETALRFFNHE